MLAETEARWKRDRSSSSSAGERMSTWWREGERKKRKERSERERKRERE